MAPCFPELSMNPPAHKATQENRTFCVSHVHLKYYEKYIFTIFAFLSLMFYISDAFMEFNLGKSINDFAVSRLPLALSTQFHNRR